MFFQCGEGVKAVINNSQPLLRHPDSNLKTNFTLPSERNSIYFGQIENKLVRGISGIGFMEHEPIYTIECKVPRDREFGCNLKARRLPTS
jgi:hypothetical protein